MVKTIFEQLKELLLPCYAVFSMTQNIEQDYKCACESVNYLLKDYCNMKILPSLGYSDTESTCCMFLLRNYCVLCKYYALLKDKFNIYRVYLSRMEWNKAILKSCEIIVSSVFCHFLVEMNEIILWFICAPPSFITQKMETG